MTVWHGYLALSKILGRSKMVALNCLCVFDDLLNNHCLRVALLQSLSVHCLCRTVEQSLLSVTENMTLDVTELLVPDVASIPLFTWTPVAMGPLIHLLDFRLLFHVATFGVDCILDLVRLVL
jgi:hypothetical protein